MNDLAKSEKLKVKSDSEKLKAPVRKRAYIFALRILKLIDSLPKDSSCQIIGKQLIRSATSIGANITEAQAASSKRDFTNFFHHALKSTNETKFWLSLLRDSKKVAYEDIEGIIQETYEIGRILGSSILTLKGKN